MLGMSIGGIIDMEYKIFGVMYVRFFFGKYVNLGLLMRKKIYKFMYIIII